MRGSGHGSQERGAEGGAADLVGGRELWVGRSQSKDCGWTQAERSQKPRGRQAGKYASSPGGFCCLDTPEFKFQACRCGRGLEKAEEGVLCRWSPFQVLELGWVVGGDGWELH